MTGLPKTTVARLPRYLRFLEEMDSGREMISSADLASTAGITAANVRRDLSYLGFHGVRGLGYSVPELRNRIRRELGIDRRVAVAIIGAGNLGRALANYGGLARRGFDVAAVYDSDPRRIGSRLGTVTVRHVDSLEEDCTDTPYEIAIVAVPANAAQGVADRLVEAGVRSLLNFAPVRLRVPDGVTVRQVDLSTELQILSYYRTKPSAKGL